MLLLDLNFADVARMLDHLRDESCVASSYLTGNSFGKIDKASNHPVLVKHTNAIAVWFPVVLDHAELAMNGPEDEEDDKEVVSVPESLEVCSAWFLNRCHNHCHESSEHDIAGPSRTSDQVGHYESHEPEFLLGRELSKVVPMCNCVDPGEEYYGPRHKFMERNVLVQLYDSVEWCLASQRDEGSADGQQDEGDIDVEYQSRRSGNGIRKPKYRSRAYQCILQGVSLVSVQSHIDAHFEVVIHEAKSKDHSM